MQRDEVVALYDEPYAESYDERFLLADCTSANADHELAMLRELLRPGSRWLDAGCGTGYFLSKFPEVERAGLDLSPAMLAVAGRRNPTASLHEGDLRDPRPEWRRRWSLVSCMWAAYAYVESMAEVEAVVANLVEWTAPDGALLLPIIDLPDLRNVDLTYCERTYFSGEVYLNGYIWSWTDAAGETLHKNLLAPHTAQFVEWLSPNFEEIRIVHYPTIFEGMARRKAVLALGRREPGRGAARVSWEADEPLDSAAPEPPPTLTVFSPEELVVELTRRLRPDRVWRGLRRRLGRARR